MENQGKAETLHQAWRNANEVPGNTLAEQVERALHRSYTIEALRSIREAIFALDPTLAARFWKLLGGQYLNAGEDEKAELVAAVKTREPHRPEPVQAAAPSMPMMPHTGDLSDVLERTFGIAQETAALKTPAQPYLDDRRRKTDEEIDAENAEILGHVTLPSNLKKAKA